MVGSLPAEITLQVGCAPQQVPDPGPVLAGSGSGCFTHTAGGEYDLNQFESKKLLQILFTILDTS